MNTFIKLPKTLEDYFNKEVVITELPDNKLIVRTIESFDKWKEKINKQLDKELADSMTEGFRKAYIESNGYINFLGNEPVIVKINKKKYFTPEQDHIIVSFGRSNICTCKEPLCGKCLGGGCLDKNCKTHSKQNKIKNYKLRYKQTQNTSQKDIDEVFNILFEEVLKNQNKSDKDTFYILGEEFQTKYFPNLSEKMKLDPVGTENEVRSIANTWHEGSISSAVIALESDLGHF